MSAASASPDLLSPVASFQAEYLLGPDRHGLWVAIETHGLGGGFFRTREAAEDYAAFETAHRPGAVRVSATPLELTI